MAEEKKQEFKKTKEMSADQVREIIGTKYGIKLKMNDIPSDHNIVMKILKPVDIETHEKIKFHNILCEYEPKGCEEFEVMVQAGENCIKRLQEKFPNESYVGMYAFFSRTSYQGKNPQFINPIKNYHKPKTADELFTEKKAKAGAKPLDLSMFADFKKNYLEKMKENDVEPNAIHMLGSYIGSTEKERVAELIKLCQEALK